jgi:hypothetical protein
MSEGRHKVLRRLFPLVFVIQWNLDLSFFKGMEKTNNECGKMINMGNYYTF